MAAAGSHETGDSDGDHGPEGVDADIDWRRMAATDDALMELVRDRIEDRESERPGPRLAQGRCCRQGAPEEQGQDAEHSRVTNLADHEIQEIVRDEPQVRLRGQHEHQPGPRDDWCPDHDRPGGTIQHAPKPLDHPDRIRAGDARTGRAGDAGTDASPSATLRR
jgi:hypothetical protein